MKLGFMAKMSKQKPSLRNGSQKHHPDPKKHSKFGPMWKWCWLCLFILRASWISTSWPHSEKKYYSESDEKAERGSEEKMAWCEGQNNDCSIMTTLQCIPPFWFVIFSQHMRQDDAHPQPPPNLPPTDFFLLTKQKSIPKGWPLKSVKETEGNSFAELSSIPKEAFHDCFQNWKKCRKQCIKSGEYFEGNKAQ